MSGITHDALDQRCACTTCTAQRWNDMEAIVQADHRLFGLCVEIARHDGINTFHSKVVCNDGNLAEYEFLNEDGTIFAVRLDRDMHAAVETYEVIVKRYLGGDEWFIESISTMVASS